MTHMYRQMTTLQKKELPKNQKPLRGFLQPVLLSVLLVYSLACLPSYSNAGQGVDSNTITSGTTTTTSTGTATSETVTNDDGSETTTLTTPITTTTTTTTVTQTEVGNIVKNPTFTNSQGGGSSTDWTIAACGGSGCAFGPTHGFMTSYGTGTITQTQSASDLGIDNDINAVEAGQGMTFSFGADVRNNFRNQIGGDYSQGGTTDTWSIKLEIFDEEGTLLGDETIGVTGGANIGSTLQTNQTETGTLHIDSGSIVNSGTITLSGIDNGYWAGYYGPRFNNIFTTFLYNEIETEISTSLSYSELISTVSCEILGTCITEVTDILTEDASLLDNTTTAVDTELSAPAEIQEIAELPSAGPSETTEVSTTAMAPPPMEIAPIQVAPVMEMPAPATEMQVAAANIEMEINNDLGQSLDTTPEAESGTDTQVEPEPTTPEPQQGPQETTETESQPEPEGNTESSESNESKGDESSDKEPEKAEVKSQPKSTVRENKSKPRTETKTKPKPKSVKQKRQAKQKAARKIVKNMGDKGKYEGGNQLKTLVIMSVLGDSKSFFNAQRHIPDTPNFFSADRIPDNTIADNTGAAYYMIGGSDVAHRALVDSQYK